MSRFHGLLYLKCCMKQTYSNKGIIIMKNYSILAEYKRQYLDKYKDQKEPVIADSSYGDGVEMDIYLPYKDKFEPFRVVYNNTEVIELIYMNPGAKYVDTTYYKEGQKAKEVNLYNLLSAASNLIARYECATDFDKKFSKLTKEEFELITVDNFDADVAVKYCKHGYCEQTIRDVYKLLKYSYGTYHGRVSWKVEVDSYAAKHVFEDLLAGLSSTTYVHTEEFTAALVMFAEYKCIFDTLKLEQNGPNYNMIMPDFYEVLSVKSGRI